MTDDGRATLNGEPVGPLRCWDLPSAVSAPELLPSRPVQSGWLLMHRMSDEEAIRWRVRQWREEGLGDDS